MNSSVRRGQTTKGVWVAGHKDQKVLIIDCEGTDSVSRTEEDRGKFEHTSSLFALAMSDVLIINMWTSDVGRYTASNYGVLKIVFEMNLKLFQQNYSKKILILLRDFDPSRNKKDKIESMILNDIYNIWSEIKIPEKYQGKKPNDFFTFEFITLPNKIYVPDQFDKECDLLKERLKHDHENYIFGNLNDIKNVPADGLQQYINQLWNDILNEKELNIPSQREMLANYRCTEIKQNILSSFDKEIKDLNSKCAKTNVSDFKSRCEDINKRMLDAYDEVAKNYDDKIYENIRNQLEENISQKLFACFLSQTKRLIPMIQKFMRLDLAKQLKKNQNDNYMEFADKLGSKYIKMLINKLEDKKFSKKWNITEQEFANIFDEIIENQKVKCLNEKRKDVVETLEKEYLDAFENSIEKNKDDSDIETKNTKNSEETPNKENNNNNNKFWIEFNTLCSYYFFVKIVPLKVYLNQCFNLNESEIEEYLSDIEKEVFEKAKREIQKKMKDFSQLIVDLFRKRFWYENPEENKMRNWNRIDESKINELFLKTRALYIDVFEQFKTFNLFKDLLNLFDFKECPTEEEIKQKVIEKMKEENEFEVLMKQGEIILMKRKFENSITNILEDAKRRREGLQISNMPYWFYILLIIFGYDDLFRIIKSFYVIYFLLIGGGYFALVKLELDHFIRDLYFDIEERIMKIRKFIKNFAKEKFGIRL